MSFYEYFSIYSRAFVICSIMFLFCYLMYLKPYRDKRRQAELNCQQPAVIEPPGELPEEEAFDSILEVDSSTIEPEPKPADDLQAQKLLDLLLDAAIRQKAEAVVIEPGKEKAVISLRFDGELQEWLPVSDPLLHQLLVQRIKEKSGDRSHFQVLNRNTPAHTWSATFGKYQYDTYDRHRTHRLVHVDVSGRPTPQGDALSMSVRRQAPPRTSLFQNLGFEPEMEERFLEGISSKTGMVVMTGLCNTGKSTATYTALRLLRDRGKRIVTLESEMHEPLAGVTQLAVDWLGKNKDEGPDVQLQKALDMNPDVLMVQAFDWYGFYDPTHQNPILRFAASKGLVITAMHFSRIAYSAVRLVTPPREIPLAQVLKLICAPLQLPVLCASCAEEYILPKAAMVKLGLSDPVTDRVVTWHSRGCPHCQGSGYMGRTAAYEVMRISPELSSMLTPSPGNAGRHEKSPSGGSIEYPAILDASEDEIYRQAWREGMLTLRECGLRKVLCGDWPLLDMVRSTSLPPFLTKETGQRISASP